MVILKIGWKIVIANDTQRVENVVGPCVIPKGSMGKEAYFTLCRSIEIISKVIRLFISFEGLFSFSNKFTKPTWLHSIAHIGAWPWMRSIGANGG